jgi:hypothetical protein
MTQPSNLPLPTTTHPIPALAGPPPLLPTERERAAGYDDLLARVSEALQPSDVLEHIWIRDVVDLAWDVWRLRRLKIDLMTAASWEGMLDVLHPLTDDPSLAKGWARRAPTAVHRVEAELAQAGLTMDHVAARTLGGRIGDFERLERLIANVEFRRNNALREIDMHRAGFGLRLRRRLEEVEDAEFDEVDAPETADEAQSAEGA